MTAKQEQFNEDVVAILEHVTRQLGGLTGTIAGLQIAIAELKGEPVEPELRRIWINNVAEYLEWIDKAKGHDDEAV